MPDTAEGIERKPPRVRSVVPGLVATTVLGVLALAAFGLQIWLADERSSRREAALFSALQFILTAGFTWIGSRAASRRDFEVSLKRFAIGAYRRISDIDRIVTRLRSETRSMIDTPPKDAGPALGVIEAIA